MIKPQYDKTNKMSVPREDSDQPGHLPTCADPGFFSGGVQARRPENSLDNFFFSPQLIFQFTEGVQWFYYRD